MRVLCVEWLLKRKVHIGYVCKNYILAKKFYKDLVSILPTKLIKSNNGSDLIIESIFGSTLTFYSAESGASLRGLTFDYLILDEAAFFKYELPSGEHLWNEVLYPTIKVQGKKVIFVSTPFGKDNLFYEMYLRGISDEYPTYASLKKTIYDDAFVDADEIENIKKSIPDLSFKQEFLCEFLDSANTFFNGFEKCFKDYQYNYHKTYIGIDLSGDGSDETILTKINEKNEVEQFKIKGSLDSKYKQIADIINNTYNLQYSFVEINGLGSPMLNEIKKLVKDRHKLQEWTTTNTTKEEIISDLAVDIANRSISFNNEDKELYSQFGTFICEYTKTGKLKFEAQSNHHDDRIMSLAIALAAKKRMGNKVFTKNNFAFIDNNLNKFNLI